MRKIPQFAAGPITVIKYENGKPKSRKTVRVEDAPLSNDYYGLSKGRRKKKTNHHLFAGEE